LERNERKILDTVRSFTVVVVFAFLPHATVCAFAQSLKPGLVVGGQTIPSLLNDPAGEVQTSRLAFGPAVEIYLRQRLSFEVSALRKDLSNSRNVVHNFDKFTGISYEQRDTTSTAWEVPVLLRWYRWDRPKGSFIAAGISFRHMGGSTHVFGIDLGTGIFPTRRPFDFQQRVRVNTVGPAVAFGIDVLAGHSPFHFVPQVRYTQWVNRVNDTTLKSSINGIDMLVGVAFGK